MLHSVHLRKQLIFQFKLFNSEEIESCLCTQVYLFYSLQDLTLCLKQNKGKFSQIKSGRSKTPEENKVDAIFPSIYKLELFYDIFVAEA